MTKALKYLVFLALLTVIGLAIWKFGGMSLFKAPQANVISSEQVVLERMEKVLKLITVEAYLTELKDYKEFYYYDISPLRKQALIKVSGKVSIGYNFENFQLVADEIAKTMTIVDIPDPEVLTVEHDLDYYDITEGTFNSFSTDDFNKLNADAKELIRSSAQSNTELFLEASERKDDFLDMMRWMLDAAGWKLVIGSENEQVINIEN